VNGIPWDAIFGACMLASGAATIIWIAWQWVDPLASDCDAEQISNVLDDASVRAGKAILAAQQPMVSNDDERKLRSDEEPLTAAAHGGVL
jgi:hypothetical protein